MDLRLDDVQLGVQGAFAAFSDREIRPVAAALDKAAAFPRELFRAIGGLGYFAMRYPEPEGPGLDRVSYVLATEELARGSLAVAACCAMQSLMGTAVIHRFAEGEVRDRVLAPALRGELVGTVCMTEPDAGSDLFAMKTRAERGPSGWRLTGRKTWITSAPVADLFTVFARTGEKTIGAFLLERGAPGLAVGRAIDKMGARASVTSEVFFEDVPATCALGDPQQGGSYLKDLLAEVRVMTAALALGVARAAFDDAVAYAARREQYGKPIDRLQAVQALLADMAADVEAARQLTRWAAWRSGQGAGAAHDASVAKLFVSEAATRVCDRAARVLASYGYAEEYPIERYLRDVRFTLIGGGTSEVLRGAVAAGLRR